MSKESEAFAERCMVEMEAAKICGNKLTRAEACAIIAKCYETTNKAKRAAFTPPTPEEVQAYSIGIGWPLDGQEWCLAYEKKGWCISGRTKMVSWRSAIEYWKRANIKTQRTPYTAPIKSAIPMPEGLREWINEEMAACPYAAGMPDENKPFSQWDQVHVKEILRQFSQRIK